MNILRELKREYRSGSLPVRKAPPFAEPAGGLHRVLPHKARLNPGSPLQGPLRPERPRPEVQNAAAWAPLMTAPAALDAASFLGLGLGDGFGLGLRVKGQELWAKGYCMGFRREPLPLKGSFHWVRITRIGLRCMFK